MLPRHNLPPFEPPMEESGFGDPLGDYCDGSSFNIIQFLADNDTPIDSPLESGRSQLARGQQQPPDPHHGARQGMNGMFQNTARLPDSPPITDISGPGSSASPSSNSDSPYSPDTYGHYGVIHGNQNSNGLILGVNDLQNNLMMPHNMLQQQIHGVGFATDIKQSPDGQHGHNMNSRLIQHNALVSPQGVANFMQPYPPNQPTPATMPQVSPLGRCSNQSYVHAQFPMDVYQNLNGSDGSIHSQTEAPLSKKRRLPSGYPSSNGMSSIVASPLGLDFADENYHQQVEVIKFHKFQEELWNPLYDVNHQEISQLQVHVVADKGFNYSSVDNCFVNQKKNHFQISVHFEACDNLPPHFVKVNGQTKVVSQFKLALCGVKSEMVTSEIQIKQSTTDRKPVPHEAVALDIPERKMTKVTVPRLHFAETTLNNMRKNSKPNPDQKYFLLVVRLLACTEDGQVALVQAYQSEKIIVRATNPGQFDQPESELVWNKTNDVMSFPGRVVAGGDKPIGDAVMSVHGNLLISGDINRPSDARIKENVKAMDTEEVMDRYQKYQIVTYSYKPEVAKEWGLDEQNRNRAGMIAQQLQELYPEAVRHNGEFLTIDENRLFYDNMVVTKELVQLTHDLDKKIVDNVDELQKRIKYLMRKKQVLGSIASGLSDATFGDAKSMLSMSTTSLAEKDPKSRKLKGSGKHCHNPSCHRNEPLCNSKLTQGTIVTLVVIMAACLLAMSALYILDWHNRNHNYLPVYPPLPPPTKSSKDDIGHMIADNYWIPKTQPGVTPLMASCHHSQCQQYCCADNVKSNVIHENHYPEMDAFVPLQHVAQGVDKRSVNSGSMGKPLSSGLTIEILNMNTTIDERYCIDRTCNKKRGRYNIYIPVSAYLPTIPLQIKFNAPNGRFVNNCGYLTEFQYKGCSKENEKGDKQRPPTAAQIADNTFEVSAGAFLQSAYRFRIGYTTESCLHSEDHQHGVYEEYNLVFYRTCSPQATPTHEPAKV